MKNNKEESLTPKEFELVNNMQKKFLIRISKD